MLGAANDIVRRFAFAFQQQIGLADGIGLSIDLLTVKVRGDFLAVFLREML